MASQDLVNKGDAAAPLTGGAPTCIDALPVDNVHPGPGDSRACGPCAACFEAFSLFCIVPGFWRIALFSFFGTAGGIIPAIYFLGTISTLAWGTKAASYSAWINACQFTIAIFGAPLFGKWSDGRPRKISVVWGSFCGFLRYLPFVFLFHIDEDGTGPAVQGLWISSGITVLTAPFVGQLSGAPVTWAWMTDVIPLEHRELGFALIFSISSFSVWISGLVVSSFVQGLKLDLVWYVWIGEAMLVISLLLALTGPKVPARVREEDADPLSQQRGLQDMLLSPFWLIARKRSLRLICGAAAFLTLPDVAVTYLALPIVFQMLHLTDKLDFAKTANWFSTFPNIILVAIYAIVGIFAKRFGPARTLKFWTPVCCVLFAGPALLQLPNTAHDYPLQALCGLLMIIPLSVYPPLQALVALLVPPSRVGEGMGAVAACKNFASLLAPLIMGFVTTALGEHTEYYWTLFVGAAVVMLFGTWPFILALDKRMKTSEDTDFQWSTWTSVAGGSHMRGSMPGSVSRSVQRA